MPGFLRDWRFRVVALVVVAVFALVAWAGGVDPKGWSPSLGANLITLVVAVVIIDDYVKTQERMREAALKKVHHARRTLRRQRRQQAIKAVLASETVFPAMLCIDAGEEVIMVGGQGTVNDVLDFLRVKGPQYRLQAARMCHLSVIYGRFFKVDEIRWLDMIHRGMEALIAHPDLPVSEDAHKIGIVSALEQIGQANRAVAHSFGAREGLDLVDNFHGQLDRLRRGWDVPAARQKMRASIAPLVAKFNPELAEKLWDKRNEPPLPPTPGK